MTGGYGAADILHDCTLAVEKGQIAVIVGPNGAGKSSLMRTLATLQEADAGTATLNEIDIFSDPN